MKFKISLSVVLYLIAFSATAREFPLCLYGVNNPVDLKLIKNAGFSCIQTYKTDPIFLDALALESTRQGLKTVFFPDQVIDSSYQQKAQQWPMLAWYLVDEPDVHKLSREKIIMAHQKTKEVFSQHDTALVIGQGKTSVPYYDIPDVMMMDWYPVPHYPLTSFGDNVRYTREGMARTNHQDHPLWGVVQIFDWKNYKQYRPDNDRIGRFPTEEEIRFMSYHGILNGATGLFFYTFSHKKITLPQSAPQYWKRVKNVVTELAQFKKVLEEGTLADNPVSVDKPLLMQTWQYQGYLYSVLLNTGEVSQPLPIALTDKKFKALYGRKKQKEIPPYQVLILKR